VGVVGILRGWALSAADAGNGGDFGRVPPAVATDVPDADMPEAMAAASPPLEPPGVRARSGAVGAAVRVSVSPGHEEFGSVGPRMMAPASRGCGRAGRPCWGFGCAPACPDSQRHAGYVEELG